MLGGAALSAVGVVVAVMVLSQCWSWWSAQSWVPVPAKVLHTALEERWRKKSAVYRVTAEFSYRYGGRRYTSTDTGGGNGLDNLGTFHRTMHSRLELARDADSTVTAWVNPAQPEQARLSRTFRWELALILFPFSAIFTAMGIAICTVPMRSLRVPANGRHIAAEPGAYLFTGVLATWWLAIAFPLAAVAVAHMVHEATLVHALVIAFFGAGLLLVAKTWRLYEQRWLLGAPFLERLDDGTGRFALRLHFQPALGHRTSGALVSHRIRIELQQVEDEKRGRKDIMSTVWCKDLGEIDLAHGATSFDIIPGAPAWRRPTVVSSPAFWEVTLHALGQKTVFRLAP